MKKINFLFLLIIIFFTVSMSVDAQTTSGPSPSIVAMYSMPFDESELTLENFGLLKDSKVRSMVRQFECGGDSIVFDENGKIMLRASWSDCNTLSPNVENYAYDGKGRLIMYTHSWIEEFFDEESGTFRNFGPYFSLTYTYDWEHDKLRCITETLQVDAGLNYASYTHLDPVYDQSGKMKEAVCRENPKVRFKFNDNKSKAFVTSYGGNYEPRGYKSFMQRCGNHPKLRHVKIGKNFCDVNVENKLPMKWDVVYYINPNYGDEVKPTATSKDANGNWTENSQGVKRKIQYY